MRYSLSLKRRHCGSDAKMVLNPYVPLRAVIRETRQETDDTKTLRVELADASRGSSFLFKPGQFLQVTMFGVGEAPISICSSPLDIPSIQMSVRKIGRVTEAIHEARIGDPVGLRGPYGKGWPVDQLDGRDAVLVAGGIGMAPLRSLVRLMSGPERRTRKIVLCYGARNPSLLMYKNELGDWGRSGVEVRLTVDQGADGWDGRVGVVTSLLDDLDVDIARSTAYVCGPPVMIKFTMRKLTQLGFEPESIYASLESMMRCGIGKCGHCHFGDKHVCLDGPVFSYRDMVDLPQGFAPL